MMSRRIPVHHPRDLLALKTGFRQLLDAVGGQVAASSVLGGYPHGRLSEAASVHNDERWPRLDHVAELEAVADHQPYVTSVLARLAGCTLLPLPRQHGSEAHALADVLRGAGDLGGRTATALADGGIDAAERADLLAGLARLARGVAHAQAVLASAAPPPAARPGITLVGGAA